MRRDDTGHIWKATVADFQSILIEYFSKLVETMKASVNDGQKLFGNLCFNVHAVRGVEPDYLSFSVSSWGFGFV